MKTAAYFLIALCIAIGILARGAISADNQAQTALNSGMFFPDIPGATNPSVTQANIKQTICVDDWTTKIRPPTTYTTAMKKKLMAAAGIPWSESKSYELDHHVPLEAGGDPSSPQNLALQSHISKLWNAHVKDKLENFAHRQICAGKMTLSQGQALFIGVDWRIGYCRYFKDVVCAGLHSSKPAGSAARLTP